MVIMDLKCPAHRIDSEKQMITVYYCDNDECGPRHDGQQRVSEDTIPPHTKCDYCGEDLP